MFPDCISTCSFRYLLLTLLFVHILLPFRCHTHATTTPATAHSAARGAGWAA
jgi:hypothetical protein